MKRMISLALAVLLLLALAACSMPALAPEPTPTPTPEPTPTPTTTPVPTSIQEASDIEHWIMNAEYRYNMKYADFAEYWDAMCDGFYGDSIKTILSVISFPDKDKEIEEKRAEYAERYGDDWSYKVTDCKKTELGGKSCGDFAGELHRISERAAILVTASQSWSKTEWQDFADAHDCTLNDAKSLVEAYGFISELCDKARVSRAFELTLTIEFSGSKTETACTYEDNSVYEVNGIYVSEMLLDYSYALLNLAI